MSSEFDEAVRWLVTYNLMPEEEGKEPVLRFGVSEDRYAEMARPFGNVYPAWGVSNLESTRHLLRASLWDKLACMFAGPGVSYFVFDLGYRTDARVTGNWLKLLAKETIDEPVTKQTWTRLQGNYMPEEIVEELTIYYQRRMKSFVQWNERKHRWTNRNTQAAERARKLWQKMLPVQPQHPEHPVMELRRRRRERKEQS